MNQEAILALEAGLPGEPIPQRPTAAESRRWLEQQVWTLPVLDDRSAEEILGYGDDSLAVIVVRPHIDRIDEGLDFSLLRALRR
jgi:hypothetical protein